jgi:hypothetical protein
MRPQGGGCAVGWRGDLWQRVWAKTAAPSAPGGCILWRGACSRTRSGPRPVIHTKGRSVDRVARIVCEWFHGPAPSPEHRAGHTCPGGENKMCVNPNHLRWMTQSENEQQKQSYRRSA